MKSCAHLNIHVVSLSTKHIKRHPKPKLRELVLIHENAVLSRFIMSI